MSDLTTFRDHCRLMADPNAWARRHPQPKVLSWPCNPASNGTAGHGECVWGWQGCACDCHDTHRPKPPTPGDRALWTRLADEIDHYLQHGLTDTANDHTQPLWETT